MSDGWTKRWLYALPLLGIIKSSSFLEFLKLFAYWVILHALLLPADFFQNVFKNYFRNTFSVKQFGSRSGLIFCQALSWSKLFANVISRRH